MSARSPRRRFASPFVITLAAAIPACATPNSPATQPVATQLHADPPPPPEAIAEPTAGEPATPAPNPSRVEPLHKNPPPPRPAPTMAKWPEPSKYEQKWYVSKAASTCNAHQDVRCPEPEAGKPRMTCNPPAPIAYACPDSVAAPFKIVLRVGAVDCFVDAPPFSCPTPEPGKPAKTCNPPPPQRVACPIR